MRTLVLIVLLSVPAAVRSQSISNCTSDDFFHGLRIGQTLIAECDSMVVLNRRTYERLNIQAQQQAHTLALTERARLSLDSLLISQQAMLDVNQRYIGSLEIHERELSEINAQLSDKLDESIRNTRDAVSIARTNKVMGILLGGAVGAVLGVVAGTVIL